MTFDMAPWPPPSPGDSESVSGPGAIGISATVTFIFSDLDSEIVPSVNRRGFEGENYFRGFWSKCHTWFFALLLPQFVLHPMPITSGTVNTDGNVALINTKITAGVSSLEFGRRA